MYVSFVQKQHTRYILYNIFFSFICETLFFILLNIFYKITLVTMWLAIIWMCQNLLNSAPTVEFFFLIFLALKNQKALRVIFLVNILRTSKLFLENKFRNASVRLKDMQF